MLSYEDFLEIFYFSPGWLGNLATRLLGHCATSLERLLSIENLWEVDLKQVYFSQYDNLRRSRKVLSTEAW